MNKLKQLIWIGLFLTWSSCNRYIDQQPAPDNGPPPSSVQALTQQYPQAQNIVFTTIANNQLWQATFAQQQLRYQALASPGKLLTADQLMDDSLPDSLTRILTLTAISGGTFSTPRFPRYIGWYSNPVISGSPATVYADYTWQQQRYTARWYIVHPGFGAPFYNLELLPFQRASYETSSLSDLPDFLQATMRDQGLTFTHATIFVDEFNKRQYVLSANRQSEYWQLTFDDSGKLLAAIIPQRPQVSETIQQVDQFPSAIQEYLRRPELAGFDLNRNGALYGFCMHYVYGSLSTYQVSLIKDKQGWLFLFSDTGQLISRSFLTYGTF